MAASGLTEREQAVTRLVLQADSTAQIAERLVLSPHTVQEHLKNIFEKTGVHSRRDLVAKSSCPTTNRAYATTNRRDRRPTRPRRPNAHKHGRELAGGRGAFLSEPEELAGHLLSIEDRA